MSRPAAALACMMLSLCGTLLPMPLAHGDDDPSTAVDGAGVSAFGSTGRQSSGSQSAKDI